MHLGELELCLGANTPREAGVANHVAEGLSNRVKRKERKLAACQKSNTLKTNGTMVMS